MKEIQATTVQVKLSDGNEDQYVLVHDGERIIELAEPNTGKLGVHPDKTMLAGTKAEIDTEIKRLGLKDKLTREEKIDRRRAELQAKHEIRQGQQDVIDEK